MVMIMVMMAKLMTMTYIMTIFTIIDGEYDDFDYMTITLIMVMAIILKLTIWKMLIFARMLIGVVKIILMIKLMIIVMFILT